MDPQSLQWFRYMLPDRLAIDLENRTKKLSEDEGSKKKAVKQEVVCRLCFNSVDRRHQAEETQTQVQDQGPHFSQLREVQHALQQNRQILQVSALYLTPSKKAKPAKTAKAPHPPAASSATGGAVNPPSGSSQPSQPSQPGQSSQPSQGTPATTAAPPTPANAPAASPAKHAIEHKKEEAPK